MTMSADDPMPWPDPATYAKAVRGALPTEIADDIIASGDFLQEADSGWVAIDLNLNPITLGLIVLDRAFGDWFARRYPEHTAVVAEIRRLPSDLALSQIRDGRWIQNIRSK